jgi:hypothetical protein
MKTTKVIRPPLSASHFDTVLEAIREYVTAAKGCRSCPVCSKKWKVCEISCCPENWDPKVLKDIAEEIVHGYQQHLFVQANGVDAR